MFRVVELRRVRRVPHLAALAVVSVGFAGCSADTQRFVSNPFSSSEASRAPEATGAVAAPAGRIEAQPLPQYQQQSSLAPPRTIPAQPSYQAASYPPAAAPSAGIPSYQPPARAIETTGAVGPRSVAATGHWNRDDGAMIIVGTSDTMDSISQRYGVPANTIMKANGLPTPRALQPGQSLFIPKPSAPAVPVASAPPTRPASAPASVYAAAGAASVHVVNPGETLHSIARSNQIPVGKLASANHLPVTAQLRIGTKLTIPGARTAAATPQAAPVAVAAPAAPVAPLRMTQIAAVQPAKPGSMPAPAAETAHVAKVTSPEVEEAAKPADATGGLPSFRWPVRGRVIAGYGAKTSGKQNDGINVAVPEGTPVKAAEDGEVTYAGSELKGYGNLVLVKHANGYVTAYAHASELLVKRGEKIKRGQIIAKSGQTGEVASPQLHFEIRKGSSPVDPTQFLNGA